jgi:triacylglycerol lipase
MHHHVYLSPGMFGFGRLGSYSYFVHVERELAQRFAAAGEELTCHVLDELPTASIRRRATRLAETVSQTARPGSVIHLLGHSTGGLDARLVASPSTTINAPLEWLPQLRSVTTMNTPHYGTPLASFFTTSNGQRVLAALSMLTVAGLALGAQPLAATSVLLGFLRASDSNMPFKLGILDRSVKSVVGLVDDARSPAVREFLSAIEDDNGSMMQLCPESMDLVIASFANRPGVAYQCTASMAPTPKPRRWLATLGHPWQAVSLALFYALHRITAGAVERYPCAHMRDATPWAGDASEAHLARVMSVCLPIDANDGVVPIRSQLWGTLVWAGLGDHLDVLGHYRDDSEPTTPEHRHVDWLTSGSKFAHAEFSALMDAVATGMLVARNAHCAVAS